LDAGDLFFDKTTVSGISGEKAILRAKTLVDGFNIIGCDAVNIGSKDFAKGLEFLKKLETMASFPFISANIVDESTGELPFKEYEIVEKEGFRYGILGLTGNLSNITRGSLSTLDFIQRGKEVLNKLEKQTDLQVVLFNGTLDQANIVKDSLTTAEFLFVSGDTRNPSRSGGKAETGIVMKKLGKQGKSLGIVTVDVKDIHKPLRDLTNLTNRQKFLSRQLKRYNKKAPNKRLEEIYSDDERMLDRIKTMKTELENIDVELADKGNTVHFDFVPMNKNVGNDLVMLALVNETLALCDTLGSNKSSSKQVIKSNKISRSSGAQKRTDR